MEWWLPFAVLAAALVASIIAPAPRPRRRMDLETDLGHGGATYQFDDDTAPQPRRGRAERRSRRAEIVDDLDEPPPSARPTPPPPRDDLDDDAPAPAPAPPLREAPRRAAPVVPPLAPPREDRRAPLAARNGPTPVTDRPGVDAPSYFRDPEVLEDWPQAGAVQEAIRAFLDRWGAAGEGVTTFRKVEVVPGSNERAFAFVVVIDPKKQGKETTLLARVCVPGENADSLSRIWVTKYFDHIGERFREDVAKTPQHSRGVITVRDIAAGDTGRSSVALDYETPLKGVDPYDDIRADDVGQYRNLLNIMRMFA